MIFVFHLKSNEGHNERFSFDVYMSPLPIFTKIQHPFAWHISFLVRHLSNYNELFLTCKFITKRVVFFFNNVTFFETICPILITNWHNMPLKIPGNLDFQNRRRQSYQVFLLAWGCRFLAKIGQNIPKNAKYLKLETTLLVIKLQVW